MQIGILGAPGSGKTTVFNVLAQARAEVGTYRSGRAEPNVAVVKVPDQRLDRLTALYRPKKTVPAEIAYVDVAGIVKGAGASESAMLAQLRTVDMLLHVVRAFDDPVLGAAEPVDELDTIQLELLLADHGVVERRLERLAKEVQLNKGAPNERQARALELELFQRLKQGLDAGQPVRDLELSEVDRRAIRSYALLTAKPLLVLLNVAEPGPAAEELVEQLRAEWGRHAATDVTALAGKLEMELAELEPDERGEFMRDLGIDELGFERVIQLSYRLSSLVSFFTVGPDECRAWPVPAGSSAVDAAGAIHTDLARGFIRAETVSYDDLIACGSQAEARKRGLLRSEGKSYRVADGDVIEILHSG
jgi:GTP-binding protein YchF